MTILPQQQSDVGTPVPQTSSVGVGKEIEHIERSVVENATGVEQNKDTELPKEVSGVGVKISPTTVVLPQVVSQAGVKTVNPVVAPVTISPTIVLPLTDEEIARGLHESVTSSVRWLAEWCERRLHQMNLLLKDVSGRLVKK